MQEYTLNYETVRELVIALENEISFYAVGLDGPLPYTPQSRIYQIKIFCPGFKRIHPIVLSSLRTGRLQLQKRRLPEEDVSILILSLTDGKVDVTSEWYGLETKAKDLMKKYGYTELNDRIKTGDFTYELNKLENDSRILVVSHGTYDAFSIVDSLESILPILYDMFALYEVPEATEAWRERVNWISRLRRLNEKIGDPNRLFKASQYEFARVINEIKVELNRFQNR